ncbi:MAG TPA: hypothetical protein PK691_06220, partial [Thermomicrobiales bacterium]|nr:hypothetical protein [Thermomicrobiales bacterium]
MADEHDLITDRSATGSDEAQDSRPRRNRRKPAADSNGGAEFSPPAGEQATQTAVLDAPSMVDTSVDRSEPRQDREFSRNNRNHRNNRNSRNNGRDRNMSG